MTVSIEPEVNRTCVFVPILDDTDTEFEENLFVTLSTVPTTFERTMIGEPNRTEVIIQDDDRKWSQTHARHNHRVVT